MSGEKKKLRPFTQIVRTIPRYKKETHLSIVFGGKGNTLQIGRKERGKSRGGGISRAPILLKKEKSHFSYRSIGKKKQRFFARLEGKKEIELESKR